MLREVSKKDMDVLRKFLNISIKRKCLEQHRYILKVNKRREREYLFKYVISCYIISEPMPIPQMLRLILGVTVTICFNIRPF